MHQQSILLSIDGSLYSQYAANLCWNIALATGAKITAQHVIDSKSAREFIFQEPTGLITHKTYEHTYELVMQQLRELGRELESTYLTEAARRGIKSEFVLDEGSPADEIAKRSSEHDLIVIGHRPSKLNQVSCTQRQFHRLSVAETLAQECSRPLLIVQNDTKLWTELNVLLSMEHLNQKYLDSCLDLAELLGAKPQIICLDAGTDPHAKSATSKTLKEAHPRLKDIPVEITTLADISTVNGETIPGHRGLKPDTELAATTLPVIPTREAGHSRVTILGGTPSLFIRFLSLSSILLLPEEHLMETGEELKFFQAIRD